MSIRCSENTTINISFIISLVIFTMGITKDYLRFIPSSKCNIISSSNCNIARIKHKDDDKHVRYIATGAAEDVIIWDCKLSKKVRVIEGDKHECWALASAWRTDHLAIGYRDGSIELCNSSNGEHLGTFSGHTSPVSALAFDSDGHRLASGSMDTEVVVWDIVAEQGLFRLSGHKGPITQVQFMSAFDVIITSSKDTFIKFWDLKNGHCFKTLTGHVTEVWSFTLVKNDSYLVSGTNDSELRVWKISEKQTLSTPVENDDTENFGPLECIKVGSILRQGFGRVMSLTVDESSQILCCHGNEKMIELFHFVSEDEAVRRFHRKQRKMRRKLEETGEEENFTVPSADALTYRISRLTPVKTFHKVKSGIVSFEEIEKKVKVIVSTNSNTVEMHSLELTSKESLLERLITGPGHNTDVRCIAFDDSDSTTMVSGSANSLKVWNRPLSRCIRTIETDFVLSICFVPGGRYVLAGLKTGSLIIVDIASADIIETIEAHSKETSRVSILPNKLGCITCGGDSTAKIWNFEYSAGFFSLLHVRTLKLEESILDVCVSPDNNLIATALLDSTVKIFYAETFKFFLCLHGHKLPVTCFDISHDSTIIVTGSGDRNIKIWGLDFGNCHKSIYAHELAVTGLRFVPETHQFFTCGKDGTLKQWDADNYQRILTLSGHRGEAWSLDVSRDGYFVASVGQDRLIRVYEKSDEPLVLEDEREVERQEEEEKTLATGSESVLQGRGTIALASKKTVNAEKGAELLLECLQVIRDYEKPVPPDQPPVPLPPILAAFNAKTCDQYLRAVLRKIRSSDLEEILSILPFNDTCQLLRRLLPLLQTPHHETETLCRTIVFLLRAHHKPIISSQNLMLTLQKLEALTLENVQQLKDTVGYNLHALLCLQKEKEVTFDELIFDSKQKAKRRKQKLIKTTLMKL